ncbi:MAG: PAS domain S-box protein [Thermoanaerobaculia bacterium]
MTLIEPIQWGALATALMAIGVAVGIGIAPRVRSRRSTRAEHLDSTFFEQVRDAALVTENGTIVEANPAALAQFGYSPREMIDLPVASLLWNPDDEHGFVHALVRGPVTDFPLRLRTAKGHALDCVVTATPRFDEAGKLIGCRGLARDVTECNRIMAELRRAEQDYRGIFENAYDAILILDPLYETVLDANHRACVMYGFRREEFVGRSMGTLSVDPRRGRAFLRSTREGSGRVETFESQQLRHDGSIIHVEINATEVWHKGRRVILSVNRDISARRQTEKAIRESEERFRLLLENVTDYAIAMLDPIGRVVSWNEGAERITGYTAAEVLGQSAVVATGTDPDGLRSHLTRAAGNGRFEYQTRATRRNGSTFAAVVTLTRIVDDSALLRGYTCVTRDVTDRVELEQAREEIVAILSGVASEWTATFDAVRVPIVMLDANCEIRRLNRAAQTLAGRQFPQLINHSVRDLPGEPWRTIAHVVAEAFSGNTNSFRATEGDSVWEVSTSMAGSPNDQRAIVIAYDLTLVAQLEASVRRNEVAAALGSLVAGVAHEVRNPLFTISATLDAWEARYGRTEGIERYAVGLREQVDRLNRLMRDLLEYGKPNPLVLAEASLSSVIRSASTDCSAIAEKQGVTIVHDLIDLPPMAIDGGRMEQVFQNVIDNAIRHSPAGATVRVVSVVEDDQFICQVLDDGPGLGEQDPETLFAPMYTRRRGGTGLGLPIARNIVTAHGGTITVAGRPEGQGAVATIRLPLERSVVRERRTA